jgi:transcriptional regulator with AAA-type ATPase domain
MADWRFWEEELRALPQGGGPTALWVVRREGAPDGPLRLLCGWTADGRPAPLPLGLIYRTVQSAAPQETRGAGRAGRPLACLALPLRCAEAVAGALCLGFDPAPPWGEAARAWAEAAAARLGAVVLDLPPWPGTWMSDPPAATPWQPALFTPEELPGGRRPAGPRREGLLLPRPRHVPGLPGMVGQSKEILLLSARLATVAVAGVNVLLAGESGTGKELVARAIHLRSARRDGPFIGLNCAALPESLFESELFGHRAGAFTGAGRDKPGLLEAAHGGTFFMDEIGDMPLALQIKLLRVMQERQVRRVGELESRPVDIRFVAATHKDLTREILDGRFRLDLYYRLKVVCLELPPLRSRPEDVLPLLAHFLRRAGRNPLTLRISERCVRALHAWRWPGNVRELENEAMRFAALYPDDELIRPEHLSWELQAGGASPVDAADLGTLRCLEEANEMLERFLIRKAIAASEGRKAMAARRLGLSRQGLYKKIQRYGMVDLIAGVEKG